MSEDIFSVPFWSTLTSWFTGFLSLYFQCLPSTYFVPMLLVLEQQWRIKLRLILPSWNPQIWQKHRLIFQPCQGWSSILPSVPPLYHFTIWYILIFPDHVFFSFQVCLQTTVTLSMAQTPQLLAQGRHPSTCTGRLHEPHSLPQASGKAWTNLPGLWKQSWTSDLITLCRVHLLKMESICTWWGCD